MKKSTIKRITSLLAIMVLVVSLVGCGTTEPVASDSPKPSASQDPSGSPDGTKEPGGTNTLSELGLKIKPDGKLKVGLLYHNIDTENQARNYQQTKIECAHRGWEFVDGYWNAVDEARTNMLSFITQEVDAIVIGNMDIKPIADLILAAREEGIGVYNVDCQLIDGVISNACQPNGVAGAELAYKLGQDFMWDAKYAVITNPAIQVQMERTEVAKSIFGEYPGMVMVGEEFVSGEGAAQSRLQQGFDYAKRFFEKEGTELDIIYCSYDGLASACAEAASQLSFDTDCAIVGVDGGSQAWGLIRAGSNFKYSYAQPTELYNHSTFEIINQLQVLGLNPSDEACDLDYEGQMLYFTGYIVDQSNVPDVGETIHAAFNYYDGDPNDQAAWYNWSEAGGPYIIK